MKRLLSVLSLLVVTGALLFAAGQGDTEATTEMRPIWVWGTPAWGGDYDPEVLEVSNKWAMENFGVTFKITSGIPQDMTRDQALQLVIAEGEFPDLINAISFTVMSELAEGGRLLPLDKYLDDPENFPVYAEADKQNLLKFRVNGTLYGFPGYGWRIRADDPAWVYPMWIMRNDVYEAKGYPETSQDLLDTMRWVKQTGLKDAEGNPTIPLGTQGGHSMGTLRRTIYQFKGAGFEVDPQKRLMPDWASVEAYEATKMFNLFWREGLMSPGLFVQNNEKFQEALRFARYAFDCGSTWNVALSRSQIQALSEKFGRDSQELKDYAEMQAIMLVNPIADNPGRIGNGGYGGPPSPTVVSADIPNADGAIGVLHWYITEEGLISGFMQAGHKDVHWEYTPDSKHLWQMKAPYDDGENLQDTQSLAHTWESNENAKDPEKTPMFPPVVMYLSSPAYSSYTEPMISLRIEYLYGENGKDPILAGSEPGAPTALEWGLPFSQACLAVVQPLPSYAQITSPAPPMEITALSTAKERWDGGIAKVITAPTAEAFEEEYKSFINTLIRVANWKPIYEAQNQRWIDWMKSNNIDDRADLTSCTPLPEWKEAMGW